MRTLVIIPATSSNYLDRCLECLGDDYNVVVMNNTGFTPSRYVEQSLGDRKTIVAPPEGKTGFAASINWAIREHGAYYYDAYLMLNQDVQIKPEAIALLDDNLTGDVGLVAPHEITVRHGDLVDVTSEIVFRDGIHEWIRSGVDHDGREGYSFFCVLIKRECWEELGGLSEEFFAGGEDVEFCSRLTASAWRTRLADCSAFHSQGSAIQIITDRAQEYKGKMEEMVKENSQSKRIHVLGYAHTRANDDYSYCAFTQLTRLFCRTMKARGWHVIYYGTPGSAIHADEVIDLITEDQFQADFACNDRHEKQYKQDWDAPAWKEFMQAALDILPTKIKGREIVVTGGGGYHQPVNHLRGAITVDAHVGHSYPISKYRVFPSKTWRSFYYGNSDKQLRDECYPPYYWRDTVIYHYLDTAQYTPGLTVGDYALFIGRLNADKGFLDAINATRDAGTRLKIMGAFDPVTENHVKQLIKDNDHVDYIGTQRGAEKIATLQQAQALFCPSYYVEPFGLVAIEAQACGVPVITTDWGAYSETIRHGVTGFRCSLYPQMVDGMKRILDGQISRETCASWAFRNFGLNAAGFYYDRYLQGVLEMERTQQAGENPFYSSDTLYVSQNLEV